MVVCSYIIFHLCLHHCPLLQHLLKKNQLFPAYQLDIMEQCYQQQFIFSQVRLHTAAFCFPLLMVSVFFIFTLPPHFLLYLHLCFTPSLSCCLSVIWSRTDASSPNCGTAISALLWLLGSLSETGLGDAPPSSSKKKSGRADQQDISQNSDDHSKISGFTSAVQWSILWDWGVSGEYIAKTQVLNHRTVWQISTVM